jgi:hypothetical protein
MHALWSCQGRNWFRAERRGFCPLRCEQCWRVITQWAVWAHPVVVLAPAFEFVAHVGVKKDVDVHIEDSTTPESLP